MPLIPLPDAQVERRGSTDWIETRVGWRRLRTFDAANGTWRLTPLGKRHFRTHEPPSEFVLKMPAKFYTRRSTGAVVEHLGWFPVADLGLDLRTRIQNAMRAGGSIRGPLLRNAQELSLIHI